MLAIYILDSNATLWIASVLKNLLGKNLRHCFSYGILKPKIIKYAFNF
ncbi:hypothetical protein [uncultured Helicobacter sp.]|nr:hypothetical protein [uncultured Helicobacter sp.]